MIGSDGNKLATSVLGRIAKHYSMDLIEEVQINRPGWVWKKFRDGRFEEEQDDSLTYDYLRQTCRVLAHINNSPFSESEMPVVSCEVPGLPFRFQGVIGPNVKYDLIDRVGTAIAIRSLKPNEAITFKSYGLVPGYVPEGANHDWENADLEKEVTDQIATAIAKQQTVLISGGTSTGKTTFLNETVKLIDERRRIITVEDAREVTVPHRNRIHLLVPRNLSANKIGWAEVLDAIVRLTPDFVVCGEVSSKNAQPVFSLMGKGHPLLGTIHADTPGLAMLQFVNNAATSGQDMGITGETVLRTMEAMVGCIVQIVKDKDGRRHVTEVAFPSKDLLARGRAEDERKRREAGRA